jgi:hypothetical protein
MIIKGSYELKRFRVPSTSVNGMRYIVTVYSDGKITCDCVGGTMGKDCKHKKGIKQLIEQSIISLTDKPMSHPDPLHDPFEHNTLPEDTDCKFELEEDEANEMKREQEQLEKLDQ